MESSKRRNLVFELDHQEKIKTYLHPKKRSMWSILRRMYQPIVKDKPFLIAHIIYAVLGGLIPVISVFIIKFIISSIERINIQTVENISDASSLIVDIGLYILAFLALSVITSQLESRVFYKFMYIRMQSLKDALLKLTKIELGFAENSMFLNEVSKANNAVEGNNSGLEGIYHEVYGVGKSVTAFIFLSIILVKVHVLIPVIALLSVFLLTISENAYKRYMEGLEPEFQKVERKLSNLNDKAQDFNYGKDIRIFKMHHLFDRFNKKFLASYSLLLKKLRIKYATTSIMKALSIAVLDGLILYLVGLEYIHNKLSASSLLMIISIILVYSLQIVEITRVIGYVYKESVSVSYLYDLMDADLEIKGGSKKNIEDRPSLVFEDVWFKYPLSDNWVLKGLNLEIEYGEKIAIVGVNGVGKTTLVNLITGLYQPQKGRILFGGVDLLELSQDRINELISVVLQQYEPLAFKIKENIALTKENIDEQRVIDSLKKVNLMDKVESYKNGIDSYMLRIIEDEGVVFSGGENQKLSIARALYKKGTKLIILDEPTAALDALAEEKIYTELKELTNDESMIFISHRLASTRFLDKIVLINEGKVEQIGTHNELLRADGLYKEMYEKQASYYERGKDE